ncbi:papain fold toxin domain-containing protein [Okeania sp. SIO2C9]|uniref:papain fold toxin domain-containing protein n=1 Tax=Okeania sp. SIO2C9 TaxID=2607791 RepID=UPI0025FB028D|nr:papain fold toxin domain-containing protein [Okeania sp. SIO2C9]
MAVAITVMSNEILFDDELRQQISEIASRFQLFECTACALAIKDFLIARGISGKQVKLYTGKAKGKYGNIYHDRLGLNIATNGRHEGIVVEIKGVELIFDNIDNQGVSRQVWLGNLYCVAMDLGGEFEVTEVEF